MGNSNNPANSYIEQIKKNYSPKNDLTNPAYGRGQVYQSNYDKSYVIEKQFVTDQPVWNYIEKIHNKSEFIINYIGHWKSADENFCSSITSVSVFYEFVPHNLEQYIQKQNLLFLELRRQGHQQLEESEVWFLLMTLVEVNVQLNRIKESHKDIRPENVLFSDDFRHIKYAPIGTFQNDQNAIQKKSRGILTYLAPEYSQETNSNRVNWAKNDVYASGLTVLDGMTLKMTTSDHFIDATRLNQAKNHYSHFLYMIVEGMLKFNPEERLSFFDIDIFLQPYLNEIKIMQPFHFDFNLIQQKAANSQYVNIQLVNKLVEDNQQYLYSHQILQSGNEQQFSSVNHQQHVSSMYQTTNYSLEQSKEQQSNQQRQMEIHSQSQPYQYITQNVPLQQIQQQEVANGASKQFQQNEVQIQNIPQQIYQQEHILINAPIQQQVRQEHILQNAPQQIKQQEYIIQNIIPQSQQQIRQQEYIIQNAPQQAEYIIQQIPNQQIQQREFVIQQAPYEQIQQREYVIQQLPHQQIQQIQQHHVIQSTPQTQIIYQQAAPQQQIVYQKPANQVYYQQVQVPMQSVAQQVQEQNQVQVVQMSPQKQPQIIYIQQSPQPQQQQIYQNQLQQQLQQVYQMQGQQQQQYQVIQQPNIAGQIIMGHPQVSQQIQSRPQGIIIPQPQIPNKLTMAVQPTVPASTNQQILPQTSGLIQPTLTPQVLNQTKYLNDQFNPALQNMQAVQGATTKVS